MLEDTRKNNTQDTLPADGALMNVASPQKENNNKSKTGTQSLAKDILAILALKSELFF